MRVLVLERSGEILFERRPPTGVWSGLWSLPETALDDDVRDVVRERFGVDATLGDALAPITHGFTHFTLTLASAAARGVANGRRARKRRGSCG